MTSSLKKTINIKYCRGYVKDDMLNELLPFPEPYIRRVSRQDVFEKDV